MATHSVDRIDRSLGKCRGKNVFGCFLFGGQNLPWEGEEMLEIQRQREERQREERQCEERQREERRETMADASGEGAGGDAGAGVDYYDVVDNLINSTISSDSEAFNQQIEQQNGQ